MSALASSFVVYSCVTATVGGMVHSKGRERAYIAPFEFIFLFMPWLTLLAMAMFFFGSIEIFHQRSGVWMYFWVLQTISAGIIGGFVLMPRYFVKADTTASRLLVNMIGGLAFSALFAFTRIFLFALTGASAGEQ